MNISAVDFQVFQYINHLAVQFAFLNPVMRFLSEDAPYLFYLGVIVYWFTRTDRNRRMVTEALLSACAALGFGGVLSWLFYRDRPFVAHHVIQLIQHPANASFPSDHATGAFVIATAIWLFRRKDGYLWLIMAAGIALSRVWTGVHYPSDVAAGAMIGMMSAVLMHRQFERSPLVQKWMSDGIGLYEKFEQKIGIKKQELQ